jgi:hypothetical protein
MGSGSFCVMSRSSSSSSSWSSSSAGGGEIDDGYEDDFGEDAGTVAR